MKERKIFFVIIIFSKPIRIFSFLPIYNLQSTQIYKPYFTLTFNQYLLHQLHILPIKNMTLFCITEYLTCQILYRLANTECFI